MIIVKSEWGHLVKSFHGIEKGLYGIHSLFGFINAKSCENRLKHRKRKGLPSVGPWRCLFNIDRRDDDSFVLKPKENCTVKALEKGQWKLATPRGNFYFSSVDTGGILFEGETIVHEGSDDFWRSAGLSLLLFVLLFLVLWVGMEAPKEEEVPEPVEVTVIKDQKAVSIKRNTVAQAPKELTKEQKSRRAIRRNLGFLGMLGTTKIKTVVGGAPTELKEVSQGAGQGDAGSGGEFISGIGKGVKKTTVGNTGVAGLGGVGTKGAGGGKGGYGKVSVAGGEGPGISQIAIGDDVVLQGGLSKYAISAAIAKYLNQVRACYEEGLQRRPGMTGTVRVNFEIGPDGTVNYSRVNRSSLGSTSVENCIVTKMKGWQFPLPKGGQVVNVNYPFLLRPVNS